MGFILKTNNRKVESGTTLKAKIVSPDKTTYDYQEFPIIIQPQSLSDKEKLLRDYQTMASILDSNNPDWQITDKIRGLTEAIRAVTYSQVLYGDQVNNSSTTLIDNGRDNGGNLIINVTNGEVNDRPAYNASSAQNFSAVLNLTLKVGSGANEEKMLLTRAFVVPAYAKEEILALLSEKWNDKAMWDAIKGNNINKNNIYTSVTQPSVTSVINALGLSSKIDTSNQNNLPTLDWTYPSYFTETLLSSNGAIGDLSATDIYQADRSQYTVEAIVPNQLSADECTALSLDTSNNKNKGETVLYRLTSKTSTDNRIKSTWTLGGSVIEKYITSVGFLSQKVDMSKVRENVLKSVSLGWFIPQDVLDAYGQEDTIIPATNTENNPFVLNVPENMHLVLQLPNRLSTMVTSETNGIADINEIGYMWNAEGDSEGFTERMFANFSITSQTQLHSTLASIDVTDASDADPSNSVEDGTTFTSGGSTKYLYLNANELTQAECGFTIAFANNTLSSNTSVITVYIKAKHTT